MGAESARKRALVTGANGIVGWNLLEEIATREDWETLAIARRRTATVAGVAYARSRFTDAGALRAALAAGHFTHLFFAAYQHAKDPYEECAINATLLRNTLDALRLVGAPLRRVVICEGAKAYGALIKTMRTPAKETDPRVPGPLLLFDLEDLLFDRGRQDGFGTTILRPDYIAGIGFGSYANLVNVVVAVTRRYARNSACRCISRAVRHLSRLFQITDARLLARGMVRAARTAGCGQRNLQHHQWRSGAMVERVAAHRALFRS